MRLLLTTTLAAASTPVLRTSEASRLAHNVLVEYGSVGSECNDFDFSSSNADDDVDVGVLTCDEHSLCVLDDSSSHGGRCIASSTSRELQTCTKCVGTNACGGLNQAFIDNYIGCGSCIGTNACSNIDGELLSYIRSRE